jgi:hypothetical protein
MAGEKPSKSTEKPAWLENRITPEELAAAGVSADAIPDNEFSHPYWRDVARRQKVRVVLAQRGFALEEIAQQTGSDQSATSNLLKRLGGWVYLTHDELVETNRFREMNGKPALVFKRRRRTAKNGGN